MQVLAAPTATHVFHKHQCACVSCSHPCDFLNIACRGHGGASRGGAQRHPQHRRSCCASSKGAD
ncbi:hypothetical protein GBAR_LOCUS16989 [Geodia barretti]|uniref:Uncharacterized protein n=1 Tax=Geodia barretti TaxID=519541 RepID=A0AA35SIU2_GEOBA|nr:hypothetical protein GBAR_LOCUS16989 [Geodia barretti]